MFANLLNTASKTISQITWNVICNYIVATFEFLPSLLLFFPLSCCYIYIYIYIWQESLVRFKYCTEQWCSLGGSSQNPPFKKIVCATGIEDDTRHVYLTPFCILAIFIMKLTLISFFWFLYVDCIPISYIVLNSILQLISWKAFFKSINSIVFFCLQISC